MPFLNIYTSEVVVNQKAFLEKSSEFIANLLNKSKKYVMIKLDDSLPMYFSDTGEPACFIELRSIGALNPSKMSEKICEFYSKEIGIPTERIYIHFQDVDSSMWGWNNKTFG